jgi:hypothetical protein
MATNNEVSESEEKSLTKKGFKKGDPEWEALGIAKYVNWPRTTCSINGVDINGKPLSGNYLTDSILAVPMSQGFVSNVKYFKCSWTPRKPEEYLLSNVLCLHIKEMIELQNAIEVDNVKNVLILNKEDLNDTIFNDVVRPQIENVWVNQNIIFSTDEMKALKQVFGEEGIKKPMVNATKSMIGHLLGAAGAVGTIATVLQIQNGFIHPNRNLENIDPELVGYNLAPNHFVEKEIKAALVDAFGFGGQNACLLVTRV